ncbi:MAG: ABC transporter permease [Chloroflexi bacterium]|nr:ABC transporter permease [Chloroflexota bacterium]
MAKYILQRLLVSIPVLFGVTVIAYFIMTLAPGDAVDMLVNPGLSAEDIALKKKALGLDQPAPVQYIKWLKEVAHGNLGYSFTNRQPVTRRIGERIKPTLTLAFSALFLSYLIAIPIGVLSAVRQYSLLDYAATIFSFLGVSIPSFFFGLLMIYIFALKLDLLPTGGTQTIGAPPTWGDRLAHLVLPMIVLSLQNTGVVMRYTRSSMLDVIHQDYVRTARAKGLHGRVVIFRHALRNALIPVITLAGLQFPFLLGGAIITEQIFNWPGMGRLAVEAINQRDYPTIMGLNLLAAVMVIIGNLLADVFYGIVDPRIRYARD